MPVRQLSTLRKVGESAVDDATETVRSLLQVRIRHAIGVKGTPPPICVDPETSYLSPQSATRLIHGDLASMLVGGIASLLLQMLHPLTMTGVAQHSRYREDPLGRLARTAAFVRATTFGSVAEANEALERVRSVHSRVSGVADDGRTYSANDPHLVEWVHVAELSMFLAASRAYGPRVVTERDADRYVDEMARIASELGVQHPPRAEREMLSRLEGYRPELHLIEAGREARDFVLRGVSQAPQRRLAHTTLAQAAVGVLPAWARRGLDLDDGSIVQRIAVRPGAMALCLALRFAVPPAT